MTDSTVDKFEENHLPDVRNVGRVVDTRVLSITSPLSSTMQISLLRSCRSMPQYSMPVSFLGLEPVWFWRA